MILRMPDRTEESPPRPSRPGELTAFRSDTVDRIRAAGNVWKLPGGELLLPRVFGFCRGVERAMAMLEQAVTGEAGKGTRFFLLGEIIHNPWVNDYFRRRGVRILTAAEIAELEKHVSPSDCAVIPAFGVPLPIERRLGAIGCRLVDTSCGDVRRLWAWAQRAARSGYGIAIFGRARHDETVVTKSRLADFGGQYVVLGSLDEVRGFCAMLAGKPPSGAFAQAFGPQATNAASIEPFLRLAQVSQTTMLYDDTMQVRQMIEEVFVRRFGRGQLQRRLQFEPTVCRATQARQTAAVELCQGRPDLVIVVGGFGSSNTRHLYELARSYAPAFFIEDVRAIQSESELRTVDIATNKPLTIRHWLPPRRPVRIAILAGASSPEIVVGHILERLAEFLR